MPKTQLYVLLTFSLTEIQTLHFKIQMQASSRDTGIKHPDSSSKFQTDASTPLAYIILRNLKIGNSTFHVAHITTILRLQLKWLMNFCLHFSTTIIVQRLQNSSKIFHGWVLHNNFLVSNPLLVLQSLLISVSKGTEVIE